MSMTSAAATLTRRRAARLLVPLLLLPMLALLRPPATQAIVAASPIVGIAAHPSGNGYWVVGQDGGIFTFGDIPFYGSMGGKPLAAPIVGMAVHPSGNGYWLVARDGGIFTFGNIPYYGSMGGKPLAAPVVGMAAHPSGNGYWLVASDGGIFTFGNIPYHGSMGGKQLVAQMVGIGVHPNGEGYWTVAADGGMFTFGNIPFYGSIGGKPLDRPVVGMGVHPAGSGYWEVASDGGIFTFGNIAFYGSMGGQPLASPVTGMAVHPSGNGYWLVAADGGIFTFGNIPYYGSVPGIGTETPGGSPSPTLPPGGWVDDEHAEFSSSTAVNLNSYGAFGFPLDGGEQSLWKITNTGGTSNGLPEGGVCDNVTPGMTIWDADMGVNSNKAFDNSSLLWVNNQIFHSSETFIDGERSFRSGPKVMSGVRTSLQYYAATQTATLRTMASFHNTGTATANLWVVWANNVAFNAETQVPSSGSSDGNNRLNTTDRWVVMQSSNVADNPMNVSFVFGGPNNPTSTATPLTPAEVTGTNSHPNPLLGSEPVFGCPGAGNTEGANVAFNVSVPPGETKSLLFFQDLNTSGPNALADATRYDNVNSINLGNDLLKGLTALDLARVANWDFDFNRWVLTGPGEIGGPRFRMWGADLGSTGGTLKLHASALSEQASDRGGVNVASGNLDADLFPEIVTASGPNSGPPRLKVWDVGPTTGLVTQTVTITAADPSFTGGLATTVLNTAGMVPVVAAATGPSPGTDSFFKLYQVTMTTGEASQVGWTVKPFPGYSGGLSVAAGNVDGQPGDELIVGTLSAISDSSGVGPRLAVYKVSPDYRFEQIGLVGPDLTTGVPYNPFPGFNGGISVGAGSFDNVAGEELVVGRLGPSSGHSDVRVLFLEPSGILTQLAAFNVFEGKGAHVASANLIPSADDLRDELVVGSPPGYGPPLVRIYRFSGTTSLTALSACGTSGQCEFRVYNVEFTGGVRVAGVREDAPQS